jgi:hypothetical protein
MKMRENLSPVKNARADHPAPNEEERGQRGPRSQGEEGL